MQAQELEQVAVRYALARANQHTKALRIERDTIDGCNTPEWRIAHGHYADAAGNASAALNAAIKLGAIPRPHWY